MHNYHHHQKQNQRQNVYIQDLDVKEKKVCRVGIRDISSYISLTSFGVK